MARQRRTEPDEEDLKDGISFDKIGRMRYHSEFHPQHGEPFSVSDLIYLCKFHKIDSARSLSFALGKTESTVMSRLSSMKKSGDYDIYRNMDDTRWEVIPEAR